MVLIEPITYGVAGLGAALLALLAGRIQSAGSDVSLKKFRSNDEGQCDLLNYAAVVDDGVIACKDGALMAAYLYKGADDASSTAAQRESVSLRINQAFAGLGGGWMVHVDAVRRPSVNYSEPSASSFPDALTAAIDEERRRAFESMGVMFEGYFVLTITWLPPSRAQSKIVEMMFDDDVDKGDARTRYDMLIEQFKREIASIESRLSSAVNLMRLRGHKIMSEDGAEVTHDDFLSFLQFCITGRRHPVQLLDTPVYLDALLGGQELYGGVIPKIGRNFIQVVSIDGFPSDSHPGILSALGELSCDYRWSTRFIFLDDYDAVTQLEKYRKKWAQKIIGFWDVLFNNPRAKADEDAQRMDQDGGAAIADIKSRLVAPGYYTSVVVLMSEDRARLDESVRRVEKAINHLGFGARVETINTMDAYFGSLPGHGYENVRRPLINTMNLADLMPTSTIWTGLNEAPCPLYPPRAPALMHCVTHGETPFRLNLHVGDLGHAFMFGPTGAGKSTHLTMLAAQLRRYEGMEIYAFDKGESMYPMAAGIRAATKGGSGLHFSIGADGDALAFCPLQFLAAKSDRAWAMEWVDTILALNGVDTTPQQRNEIGHAIMSMYNSGARTISEFVLTVQDSAIREALKQYTIEGSMGHLLDAAEDGLSMSDFTVFEIEELMNLGEKFALPVLLYLFRRVERALTGKPSAIFLDEAWLMLGHPVFRAKIREWLKVLRKANCIVVMATQSLSDAANSGILDVILESTATKIYLPNVHARDEDATALYRRMGLNTRQIEILATAIPKRQYYYVSANGRRIYDLALGPLALAFAGATDKESVAEIKALESRYGHEWIDQWLDMRGLSLADYEGEAA